MNARSSPSSCPFSAVAYAAAAVAQERLAARTSGAGVLRLLRHPAWWWSVVLNASAALLHVAASSSVR